MTIPKAGQGRLLSSERLVHIHACMQDAVARKMSETPHIAIIAGVLGIFFFVPLTLSLWRFALYGLT